MQNRKNILLTASALALTAAVSIGGTMAYLQSITTPVANTFAMGSVTLDLDEPVYLTAYPEGTATLIPDTMIPKDPTLTVAAGSETCYVFAEVVQADPDSFADAGILIQAVEEGGTVLDDVFDSWDVLSETTDPETGVKTTVYNQKTTIDATAGDVVLPLFTRVNVPAAATDDQIAAAANNTITIKGYAIQAQGLATAQEAWDSLRIV